MNKYTHVLHFYKRIFFVILLVNVLLFGIFGMYLEDYEVFFSTFLHGTYTKPWGWELDLSSHILILYAYEWLAALLGDFNTYGLILVVYNFWGFIFIGLVLHRILKINLLIDSLPVFLLLYLIIITDNFINLNSTRQTFVFMVSMVGFIESRRAEKKGISVQLWIWISLYYVFVSLLRFESVWLFSLIYLSAALLLGRFKKYILLPLMISGAILLIYYNALIPRINEARQTYIYKEREFFDRLNINYEKLPAHQKRDVDAIMMHGVTDREFFTLAFYDSISKYNANNNIFSLSDGLKIDAFRSAFHQSVQFFKKSSGYIVFYIITAITLLWYVPGSRKRNAIYSGVIVAIPLLLCSYTVVPVRFLIPYYSIFSVFNILFVYKHAGLKRPLALVSALFLVIFIWRGWIEKKAYENSEIKFRETSAKLHSLSAKNTRQTPIIINSFYQEGYFTAKPLCKLSRQNAMFLNFYYFTAWDMNMKNWEEACRCNPLSLKEQIDYMVSSQNLFIVDPGSFDFLKQYMKDKYNVHLGKTHIGHFYGNQDICRLHYDSKIKK